MEYATVFSFANCVEKEAPANLLVAMHRAGTVLGRARHYLDLLRFDRPRPRTDPKIALCGIDWPQGGSEVASTSPLAFADRMRRLIRGPACPLLNHTPAMISCRGHLMHSAHVGATFTLRWLPGLIASILIFDDTQAVLTFAARLHKNQAQGENRFWFRS